MLNKDELRIAISGRSGCGNTTVSRMLSKRLKLKLVNYTFRSIAEEDGLSFEEICRLAEHSDDYDRRVDDTQLRMAAEAPCVLGSRLAIWLLDKADLKIFLTASPKTRAARILGREGGSFVDQMAVTSARDQRDHNRYMRLYGIDNNDYNLADLVLNTDRLNAKQVTDIIETAVHSLS